jgi:hypothetical protein
MMMGQLLARLDPGARDRVQEKDFRQMDQVAYHEYRAGTDWINRRQVVHQLRQDLFRLQR